MVPGGVYEKDMADTSKIVLAYSVIEETETGQDSIEDHTFFRTATEFDGQELVVIHSNYVSPIFGGLVA